MKRNGGTKLTIVIIVLIIGIIVAIQLPCLMSGRISANETSAMGTLKQLTSSEEIWVQQDGDKDKLKNYWTYDVSCFHRMYRPDGTSKFALIPMDVARGDAHPADLSGGSNPFGEDLKLEAWTEGITTSPKSGYWFRAMVTDENGVPYNQGAVGANKIPATNSTKYAFVAWTDAYGASGVRTFIVNETKTIWAVDCGGDADKIILQWPGKNPAEVEVPSGRKWDMAE